MGKSSFLNAYLQKQAFRASDSPDSCTKVTSMDSNIINNQTRKAIDTPGIKDTDNTDQENVKQLVEFLLNYNDGINVVAIVLNGQVDRFTKDTEKFIKIAHQMFNHPDFWEHLCIVFTKWYSGMTEEQKRIKQEEYKKRVIESIRKYTESDINVELPMFFVDSPNYQNEEKTKAELERIKNLNLGKPMPKEVKEKMMNSLCPYEYQIYLNNELQYTCLGHTELWSYCKEKFGISRTIIDKIIAKTWKPTYNKHKWLKTLEILKIERCIDQG